MDKLLSLEVSTTQTSPTLRILSSKTYALQSMVTDYVYIKA